MQIRPQSAPLLPDLEALQPGRSAGPGGPHPSPATPGLQARRGSALWEVLTPDEQAFFQEQQALGPLQYGRASREPMPGVPTGQRLDVRA